MSELGPSSFERPPRSMDSPGRNADIPFNNQELFGGISEDPEKRDSYDRFGLGYDEGDVNYDDLPDYSKPDIDYPEIDTEAFGTTSEKVQDTIGKIEETESIIEDNTGLDGQELSDATSEFLVDSAIDAVEKHSSDEEELVGTVLIDGALQATDQRPKASVNPIIELKKNNLDEQVISGVEKLHEEGATLPDGEPVAEVVAKVVDKYDGESSDKSSISDELDLAIQYYTRGASKEDVKKAGIDPSIVTKHLKSLPKEEADYLKETRHRSLGEDETVGAQVPAETKNQENWRDSVDPKVLALATNPDSITDPVARREVLDKAVRISGGERIILQDNEGSPRWGEELSELGQVFAFNGNIRGNYDSAPEDPEELRAQRLDIHLASRALRGSVTHVIVETEDGQQLMIRRTNETNSANDQLFDVASTARAGTDSERRSLDSSVLKDVVAVVGEPLVLGIDPQTGKHIKTRSPITKITTLDMRKDPVDPSHPRLSKPELRRDTVGEFGEAMRAARNHSVDKVAVDEVESLTAELPSDKIESTNPYESLAPEQLAKVRDNIADSIVQGIRKYDLAEVTRASANLAAIQREIETRSPDTQPAHKRGEVDGAVTYITEPDKAVVQKIVGELQKIDGASDIARAMYGGLEAPQQDESDPEAVLQAAEMSSLLANISREIRSTTGSDLAESTNNPYASMKNEELTTTVDRLKQTIQEHTAQGLDTTDFRNRLALVGRIIQSRQ